MQSLFQQTKLNLKVAVTESPTECLLDLSGPDSDLLQAEGGELLQALQHLVSQAFGRKLAEGQRLVCDVEGFRATREAELREDGIARCRPGALEWSAICFRRNELTMSDELFTSRWPTAMTCPRSRSAKDPTEKLELGPRRSMIEFSCPVFWFAV